MISEVKFVMSVKNFLLELEKKLFFSSFFIIIVFWRLEICKHRHIRSQSWGQELSSLFESFAIGLGFSFALWQSKCNLSVESTISEWLFSKECAWTNLSSKNVLKKKQQVKARIKYFILFKHTKLTF